ncbi:hypothetical protein [Edwardsiella piscicida]|uniref:Uncharacterized protein n=2 Tax=Edwardsiella piscicida TaxID=1263550 RepID=A0AAQ3C4R1_EDWPI|nr:hypothetical protein [Edwardsiella piscicida]ACY84345.1 hypothetical protein ETAE_1504 [Edwardsiella tarda EIB202]EKS7767343.1 hypothetical protein [Edwardsiella piscicida]EKS7779217.1 hypothetical protein [Edwardsiella piscicida]EKS7782637.1 hypothetical protein [Edwardsiella piscicida]EKS7794884.1 hypothetical protein [Edwardsiella piscicida]
MNETIPNGGEGRSGNNHTETIITNNEAVCGGGVGRSDGENKNSLIRGYF